MPPTLKNGVQRRRQWHQFLMRLTTVRIIYALCKFSIKGDFFSIPFDGDVAICIPNIIAHVTEQLPIWASTEACEQYCSFLVVAVYRFSSDGKKYWREIQKSLTLLQYLLTHGPDYLVLEFRNDKDLDRFARFEYVDENM